MKITKDQITKATKEAIYMFWDDNPKHRETLFHRKILKINEFAMWLFAKKRGFRKYDFPTKIIVAIYTRPLDLGLLVEMGRNNRIYYIAGMELPK